MKHGKLNIVMGLQWGSEAKGKMVHFLNKNYHMAPDVAISNFGPNAGHTAVEDDGTKHVFKMLPVSALNPECRLLISPGSVIDIYRMLEEVETHKCQKRLKIHPHAAVVLESHKQQERVQLQHISSTLQGTAVAMNEKMMRKPEAILAKDVPEFKEWIADTHDIAMMYLRAGAMVLAEGAQGFDLSLNWGHRWPYTTSRDVTPTVILSDAGVPAQLLGDVYGCIRTFPIRVGHQYRQMHAADAAVLGKPLTPDGVKVGDSGPCYQDQMELTWDELNKMSGSKFDLIERTTVTKKVRRVFTFSREQILKAVKMCRPTHLFLNFINHIKADDAGKRAWSELSAESQSFVDMVSSMARMNGLPDCPVTHIGTGAKVSDIIVLE